MIIAGNWKLNLGPAGAADWVRTVTTALAEMPAGEGTEVVAFPPALSLHAAALARPKGAPLALGVQQVHPAASGAFTGESSAELAREAGAEWCLVGHSERRTLFGETDAEVVRRVEAALRAGLRPLVCVGETLEERRAGRLEEVLVRQLDAVLAPPGLRDRLGGTAFAVAYEPVWAIGTGETATPKDASEAHALLLHLLRARLGPGPADGVPILYGGSVNPENAADLLSAPGVGGVLVGGASLDPQAFLGILRAAS